MLCPLLIIIKDLYYTLLALSWLQCIVLHVGRSLSTAPSCVLGGLMNSVSSECQQLKDVYDACFNAWFSEQFLRGSEASQQDTACTAVFTEYQSCVKRALNKLHITLPRYDDPTVFDQLDCNSDSSRQSEESKTQ